MKKILSFLLLAVLLVGCGKETPDDIVQPTQPAVENVITEPTAEPTPTCTPTPTPIPDDAITSLMLEEYLSTGDDKVNKLVTSRDELAFDKQAYAFDFDISLPKSVAVDSPFSTLNVVGELHSMGEEGAKLSADFMLDKGEVYTVELIANNELEMFIGLPDYSDEYAKVPLEVTTIEDSDISFEAADWENIDFSGISDIWTEFKKDAIKAVEFDRVEKEVTVGTENYSWTGTKYINKLNTEKMQYALEDVLYGLADLGMPIDTESIEMETVEDSMEFNYCVNGEYKAYELVNTDTGYYVGLIETEAGLCYYQYDADFDVMSEILTTEKDSDTEGTFYLMLDGMEVEGAYEVDDKGWVLSDIVVMDTLEIDTVGYRNGAFILEGGLDEDGVSLEFEIGYGKKEAYCDVSFTIDGESMLMSGGFEPIELEEFEIPERYVEGEEELNGWLEDILVENPELLELFAPTSGLEENEVPIDWEDDWEDELEEEEEVITDNQWDNLLVFSQLLDEASTVSGDYDMDRRYSYIGSVNYATQSSRGVETVNTEEYCEVWDGITYFSTCKDAYDEESYIITSDETIAKVWKLREMDEWDVHVEPNEYLGDPIMRLSNLNAEDFCIDSIKIYEDDESYYVTAHAPIDLHIEGMVGFMIAEIWDEDCVKDAVYEFTFNKSNGQLQFLRIDWTFDEEAVAEYKGLTRFSMKECSYLYYPTEEEIKVPEDVLAAIAKNE